jgi:hypothetical protein
MPERRNPHGKPDGVEERAVPLVRRDRESQSFPASQAQGVPRRVAAGDGRPRGGALTGNGPGSAPGFEIEAATIEEFLLLLKEREEYKASRQGSRSSVRRAVFVARMLDQRSSRYGFPLDTRYVVAAFAYERDLISYRRTTSNAVELPETALRTEERQREAYEEVVAEIERGLDEEDVRVPIYEGRLRRPINFDQER